jgi:hypothetical protein
MGACSCKQLVRHPVEYSDDFTPDFCLGTCQEGGFALGDVELGHDRVSPRLRYTGLYLMSR